MDIIKDILWVLDYNNFYANIGLALFNAKISNKFQIALYLNTAFSKVSIKYKNIKSSVPLYTFMTHVPIDMLLNSN